MIFIINNLKYDTDKMELISDKTKKFIKHPLFPLFTLNGRYIDSKIYKSKKSRYLEVYEEWGEFQGCVLSKKEVKTKLIQYDVSKYEELFRKFKEA